VSEESRPLPAIGGSRLLEYAHVGDLPFESQHDIYVGEADRLQLLGAVPVVAIFAPRSGSPVTIAYCSADWEPRGLYEAPSIEEAKRRVEREYPGSGACWRSSPYTEADLEAHWAEFACSFCRRPSHEFHELVTSEEGDVKICGDCIRAFHAELEGLPEESGD
jgi:hypothetical protein